jgi:CDP-paratose 2-epimerase
MTHRGAGRRLDYLVTGGAGFIGSNYVHRLLSRGERVVAFDDLSRPGVRANLEWLRQAGGDLEVVVADVCDAAALEHAASGADVIVHLAGQTAVTTSLREPLADFRANALGTMHVLEAARRSPRAPIVLYASTNKVYGSLEGVDVVEEDTRYAFRDLPHGVPEAHPLDFHSPYACSKGAGDQYARDYFRIYGVRTVVLRQSCVYGPRQMGATDQGWLAWFMAAGLEQQPITVFGNGKQARDVLYVDDLLDAYDAAIARVDVAAGQVYNIGGGPERVLSVWTEFRPHLERLLGHATVAVHAGWRPGDQRVYLSDIRKARRDLGWTPRVSVGDGLSRLFEWVRAHRPLAAAGR